MINPRVDIAFKKIFGVEENKDILISLLNAIISEEDQIDEIELLNPYNERNFQKDKLSILDIKARNKITQTYFLIARRVGKFLQEWFLVVYFLLPVLYFCFFYFHSQTQEHYFYFLGFQFGY